jgi:hypothetical protein
MNSLFLVVGCLGFFYKNSHRDPAFMAFLLEHRNLLHASCLSRSKAAGREEDGSEDSWIEVGADLFFLANPC